MTGFRACANENVWDLVVCQDTAYPFFCLLTKPTYLPTYLLPTLHSFFSLSPPYSFFSMVHCRSGGDMSNFFYVEERDSKRDAGPSVHFSFFFSNEFLFPFLGFLDCICFFFSVGDGIGLACLGMC